MERKDIISTFISTIIIFALIFISATLTACQSKFQNTLNSIEETKIEEIDNEDRISYIGFYWTYVQDIVYYRDDNGFIIEYYDPDTFDWEKMKQETHRTKWYGEDTSVYIPIQIDNKYVSQFLIDYNNETNEYNWEIVEQWIPEVEDYLWYLQPRNLND